MDQDTNLPPEDDWFAEPGVTPDSPGDVVRRVPRRASRPARPTPEARRRMVGMIGLVVIALAFAGGVLAWALGGGDDGPTVAATTTDRTTPPTTQPPATTPGPTTPPTTQPPSVPEGVILRQGDTGDSVRALQRALSSLGYDVAVDGNFGPQTRAAVVAFQTASGLVADGVAGPQTLAALAEAVAGASG